MPTSTTEPIDKLPDHILLHILNLVGDVRSLSRCRCVNRKLTSLVPQADDLRLRVDAIIPAYPEPQLLPLLHHIFTSILTTISSFIPFPSYPKLHPSHTNSQLTSPSSPSSSLEIPLRGFERIRRLEIELPVVDHKPPSGLMRWKAEFGAKFKGCVILLVRKMGRESVDEVVEVEVALKEKVIATIGVLMTASARYEMVKKVVRGGCGEGMEEVVVRDRDGEWTVTMDSGGVSECRAVDDEFCNNDEGNNLREITVPEVRLRIRCAKKLELVGGVSMAGVALVVVTAFDVKEVVEDEEEMVAKAFDGVYRKAAEELLKKNCYRLEMNSL